VTNPAAASLVERVTPATGRTSQVTALIVLLVATFLTACDDGPLRLANRPARAEMPFAQALEAGDLDAAWAMADKSYMTTETVPGRMYAVTREHFDATYEAVVPTGQVSRGGSVIFRWPDGTERTLPLGPGRLMAWPLRIVVAEQELPARTLVDDIPAHGAYTDEHWLLATWMAHTMVWPGGGTLVAVEWADGHRLEVWAPRGTHQVVFGRDPDTARAEGREVPGGCVGLGCDRRP